MFNIPERPFFRPTGRYDRALLQFVHAAAVSSVCRRNHRAGHPVCPLRSGAGPHLAGIGRLGLRQNCSTFINVNKTPLPKSTLSQHFKVLREAGLIHSVRKGVELQNEVRYADLKKRFGPMIGEILKAYQDEAKRA